jgi:hypothetical protein
MGGRQRRTRFLYNCRVQGNANDKHLRNPETPRLLGLPANLRLQQFENKKTRVSFIASDLYRRRAFIGIIKHLDEQEDWLEVEIQLSISEYESLFRELKEYSNKKNPDEQHFFLFKLHTAIDVKTSREASINFITSISNVSIYPKEDAHKIRAMIALKNGLSDSDVRYRTLCEEKMHRFRQITGREDDP